MWGQKELADAAQLSVSQIRRLESMEVLSGQPQTWWGLARAFGFARVDEFQRALDDNCDEVKGLFVRRVVADAIQAAADAEGLSVEEYLIKVAVSKE